MSRPKRPITTLRPGESVIVNLRSVGVDRVGQYAGEVVVVDAVALRLRPAWYRLGLMPGAVSGDEIVLPWSRIASVRIVGKDWRP